MNNTNYLHLKRIKNSDLLEVKNNTTLTVCPVAHVAMDVLKQDPSEMPDLLIEKSKMKNKDDKKRGIKRKNHQLSPNDKEEKEEVEKKLIVKPSPILITNGMVVCEHKFLVGLKEAVNEEILESDKKNEDDGENERYNEDEDDDDFSSDNVVDVGVQNMRKEGDDNMVFDEEKNNDEIEKMNEEENKKSDNLIFETDYSSDDDDGEELVSCCCSESDFDSQFDVERVAVPFEGDNHQLVYSYDAFTPTSSSFTGHGANLLASNVPYENMSTTSNLSDGIFSNIVCPPSFFSSSKPLSSNLKNTTDLFCPPSLSISASSNHFCNTAYENLPKTASSSFSSCSLSPQKGTNTLLFYENNSFFSSQHLASLSELRITKYKGLDNCPRLFANEKLSSCKTPRGGGGGGKWKFSRDLSKTLTAPSQRGLVMKKETKQQHVDVPSENEFNNIIGNFILNPNVNKNQSEMNAAQLKVTSSLPSHISSNVSVGNEPCPETLNPNDFISYTRKPLFIIVDSDAASSFSSSSSVYDHFNNVVHSKPHGQPVVVLMSPTQPRFVPCNLMYTLFNLHSDIKTMRPSSSSSSCNISVYTPPSTPHLIPLLPHHSAIGRVYTLALSDPLSAMLLLAHPARYFRAVILHSQILPGGSCYPFHPSAFPSKSVLFETVQKKPKNKGGIEESCACFSLTPCSSNCPCVVLPLSSPPNSCGITPESNQSSSVFTQKINGTSSPGLFSFIDSDNIHNTGDNSPSFATLVRCRELLERICILMTMLYLHSHIHPPPNSETYNFYESPDWPIQSFRSSSSLSSSSLPFVGDATSSRTLNHHQIHQEDKVVIDDAFLRMSEDPFLRNFILHHCFFNTLLRTHIAYVDAPQECFPSTNPPLPVWFLNHPMWKYCVYEIARELGVENIFSYNK
jgi:hypothetical protein